MLRTLIFGALYGLIWALAYAIMGWKRNLELDAQGNPCLRYFIPRYVFPLATVVILVIGLRNLGDPFHQRYPENSWLEFGFAAFTLLGSLYFVPYRVTLTQERIERHCWPLPPRTYPLAAVEGFEQNEFRFKGGAKFKISPFLSGREAFMDRVRTRVFLPTEA